MDDIRLLSICSSSATIAISKWAISTIHCSCVQHSRVILSWELSLQARKLSEELPTYWHYPMISNSSCTGWINKRKCKNRCKLLNVSSFEKLNTTKIYKHMHWLQFHSNGLSITDSIARIEFTSGPTWPNSHAISIVYCKLLRQQDLKLLVHSIAWIEHTPVQPDQSEITTWCRTQLLNSQDTASRDQIKA